MSWSKQQNEITRYIWEAVNPLAQSGRLWLTWVLTSVFLSYPWIAVMLKTLLMGYWLIETHGMYDGFGKMQ